MQYFLWIDWLTLWFGRIVFALGGIVAFFFVFGTIINWIYRRLRHCEVFMRTLAQYSKDLNQPLWRVILDKRKKVD